MMLHQVIRDVLYLIGDQGCSQVTIARDYPHAYQVRFEPDKSTKCGWSSVGRRWMDGTELTPTRGTTLGYVGWANWSTHLGWKVDAILADDWLIENLDPALADKLAQHRLANRVADSVTEEQGKRLMSELYPEQLAQLRSIFAEAGPERKIRPALDSSAVCPRCKLRDELVRATNYGRDTGRLHCRRCNLTLEPTS